MQTLTAMQLLWEQAIAIVSMESGPARDRPGCAADGCRPRSVLRLLHLPAPKVTFVPDGVPDGL
jgi:hypothetical protein